MPLRRLRWAILILLAVLTSFAQDLSSIPKPTGYVSDLANVLSANDKASLEDFCTKVEQQLSAQFAIVTIRTLGEQPIEDFSLNLGRKWGVGPKGKNEGLLMLLVIQDHKQRIEVGRGLEPYITDAFTGDTMRAMRPLLRSNDFGGALKQGALALATRLAEGKNIAFSETLPVQQAPRRQRDRDGGLPVGLIIFVVIFLLIFLMSRRGGGGRGTGSGFWTGFILSSILNSGRGGGSNWGGGGFGGGSGGSGGFGGFGGGDFGGGGASSDW